MSLFFIGKDVDKMWNDIYRAIAEVKPLFLSCLFYSYSSTCTSKYFKFYLKLCYSTMNLCVKNHGIVTSGSGFVPENTPYWSEHVPQI